MRCGYDDGVMSAVEIIEQIKALPRSEQAQIKAFARDLPDEEESQSGGKIMSREVFERAKEHVFKHYGPLLEELAK